MKATEKEFKEILAVSRTDKQRIEMLESLVLKLAKQIDNLTPNRDERILQRRMLLAP